MQGKVAIVTGSSRGIGRAVAFAFAERGARVLVNSATDVAGGRSVVAEIINSGGAAHYAQADVCDPQQVERMFGEADSVLGPVDVLVNNVGGFTPDASLAGTTMEHWLHILQINLLSTVACSMRAARTMIHCGGSIINTSSAASGGTVSWHLAKGLDQKSQEGVMAYSAAKAAVSNFTMAMAKHLAPHVRVNAVAPGFVATSDSLPAGAELEQSWLSHIPLRRAIDPVGLAGSYVHLAESDYLTGMILTADAGLMLEQA
ncbi:MAG TPA: SDR family oxidoreductase [Pseudonocardiaceae bacterium]